MLAYTYIKHGTFQMMEKPVPEIKDPRDAVVRVTLGVSVPAICISSMEVCLVPYPVLQSVMKWWVLSNG